MLPQFPPFPFHDILNSAAQTGPTYKMLVTVCANFQGVDPYSDGDRQRSQGGCAVESLPRGKEPQLKTPAVLLGSS